MKVLLTVLLLGVLSGCATTQATTYPSEPAIEWSKEVDQVCRESAAAVMKEAYEVGLDADEASFFARRNYFQCMYHFGLLI